MSTVLRVFCAGAAQGLVSTLKERFEADHGVAIQPRFGAVGALKELLIGGEPCDVLIVTAAMVQSLQATGELSASGAAPLGRVRTGVAMRQGDPAPDISTPAALRATLLAAPAIYFPDPTRATAGIHFASVLAKLGIDTEVEARLRRFPNGATSMRELVASAEHRAIGCTQITEINDTEGARLVGALPVEFELATVYSAAVASRAREPSMALRFVATITGDETKAMREQRGFEFDR